MSEIDDLLEHFQRYRAVTLQFLDAIPDDQLGWSPRPGALTLGQQLLHIVQTEDFYVHGLFTGSWEPGRMRLPDAALTVAGLKQQFEAARTVTLRRLSALDTDRMSAIVPPIAGSSVRWSLRSWLWYVLEHEVHHKAQLAEYLRQLGRVPPFFAAPLPAGERPDIRMRAQLDGKTSALEDGF